MTIMSGSNIAWENFNYNSDKYTINYDDNYNVIVALKAGVVPIPDGSNDIKISNLNKNQSAVLSLVNRNVYLYDHILYMPDEEARNLLDQLSGVFFTNLLTYGAINNNTPDIYSRINLNTIEETGEIWIQGGIKSLNYEKNENALDKFESSGFGAQIGKDIYNNEEDTVGGLYAGLDSINFEQGTSKGEMKDISLGLYGGIITEKTNWLGTLNFGVQNFTTERDLSYLGLKTQSDFNTYSIRFGTEFKWLISIGEGINLVPILAGLQGGYTMFPEVKEKGGDAANLTIESGSYFRLTGLLGIGLENIGEYFHWYSKIYMGYIFSGADEQKYNMSLSNAGTMEIYGMEQSKMMFGGSLGFDYSLGSLISVFANTNVSTAEKIFGYGLNLGINIKL